MGQETPTETRKHITTVSLSKFLNHHYFHPILTKKTQKPRKAKRTTKISQFSGPIHLVADETVYKEWEDRMERAATTASSLEESMTLVNINRDPIHGTTLMSLFLMKMNSRYSLTAVRHKLMLPGITSYYWSRRKQRKDCGQTKPIPDEATNEEHVATHSCDPPQSGEDRMQLTELMDLCTQLQSRVLALVTTKSNQALEIESLKEEWSIQTGREIEFEKVVEEPIVSVATTTKSIPVSVADPVTTGGEVVTTASAPTTTINELTLAQTLKEIKAAKPKAVTFAATTTTIIRPKARRVVVKEPSEFKTTSSPSQASQLPQAKDKGKSKMVEPEKPLKKKYQITIDEEVARNLEAQLQAELEEEERISRLKEEEANIALLESWDNTQAMMDADF
ncbi:hypothetical protein Tco_1524917 [Tanacetum coccineum]